MKKRLSADFLIDLKSSAAFQPSVGGETMESKLIKSLVRQSSDSIRWYLDYRTINIQCRL